MTNNLSTRVLNWSKSTFIITSFALLSIAASLLINSGNTTSNQQPFLLKTRQFVVDFNPFQKHEINPVLQELHLYSNSASNLLMGTAIQESFVGRLSNNIFQIEPATVHDVDQNFLPYHPLLKKVVTEYYDTSHSLSWNLTHNIKYEIAMARIIYLRANQPLPKANNATALGQFWKTYYNTYLGKGNAHEFATHFVDYFYGHANAQVVTVIKPVANPNSNWLQVNLKNV